MELAIGGSMGQARKSLWIETGVAVPGVEVPSVVRLVRACGSKLRVELDELKRDYGQARKSLWIETTTLTAGHYIVGVRLVRACGSKHVGFR